MMAKLKQLLLLITKNFKLQFRHPYVTLFELGIPTFFSLLLVAIRVNINSEYISEPTIYEPFSIDHLSSEPPLYEGKWELLYVPDSALVEDVVHRVAAKLRVSKTAGIKGFPNEQAMEAYYLNSTWQDCKYAGIVFEEKYINESEFKNNINYTIRLKALQDSVFSKLQFGDDGWLTRYVFPFLRSAGPRAKDDQMGGAPGYYTRGFLAIQHAVALSITEILAPIHVEDNMIVEMQRYPYPPYDNDQFFTYVQFYLPFAFMLSFVFPCLNLVKNLVAEKEKELKQAMKMMGLSNWMHATAWFIKYFLFLTISISVITVLLTVKFKDDRAVLNYSDPLLVFLLLMIYSASCICFCFLLSTLFSRANSAAAGTGIIFFLTLFPYMFIYPRFADMGLSAKLGCCLLLNTALSIASIVLMKWESTTIGLNFNTLNSLPTPDDNLTMNQVILMMFIDAVSCVLLAWYIEAVFPGEFGVPEPWYFPFTKTYWCGKKQDFNSVAKLYMPSDKTSAEFLETDPVSLMAGIQIQGLTKIYDKKKPPAVNNLHMNMYRGQITVLLGHNGAGKTTTISMLTGLFPATSGMAVVNGYDICDDIEGVHSSLGICPQRNVLFDDLTVEEHLYFFCKLKEYIPDLVHEEVSNMVNTLGLQEKRHAQAKTLSGGMKRKLSVGIALVGGSQVVMLDEPTSGMDPSARRFTWDLLQAEKEDRTILLTTHSMEEADILGDRIAIMAQGEIQCCGSPLFLKKKYGAGYHLVMVKILGCDVSAITDLVKFYVPNAEISKDIGTELSYLLPIESSHLFQNLFLEIERRHNSLMISNFGASITTMEEVFIKVGQRASMKNLLSENSPLSYNSITRISSFSDSGVCDSGVGQSSASQSTVSTDTWLIEVKNSGIVLFLQQLRALITKRALYSYRNWVLTLSQLILPPFFLILVLIVLKTTPVNEDSPPLNFSLKRFRGTYVPYSCNSCRVEERKMMNAFLSQFDKADKPVLTTNLTSYILNEGKEHIERYNLHDMIALSIGYNKKELATCSVSLFNNEAYHSPAISLLYTDNMIIKYFVTESHSLSVTNYPLPRTSSEKGLQLQLRPTEAFEISQSIVFGMSFLVASFSVFLVKEKSIRSKHLQRVSGVNLFSFWLATFLWDFLCYMLSCFALLLVFLCFQTEGMSSPVEQGHLFLLLVLHGCSGLPFVYFLSFWFQMPSTAYICICLCSVIAGIGTVLTVTVLEIPQLNVGVVAAALDWVFSSTMPNYCLGRSVSNLYQNRQFNDICDDPALLALCKYLKPPMSACCPDTCDDFCIPWTESYLSWKNPGIGKQLTFLSIQAVVLFLLLCAYELKLFRFLRYEWRRKRVFPISDESNVSSLDVDEDENVAAERHKIVNTQLEDLFCTNRLILKNLTRYYGSLCAVNNLCVGVKKGECFGLLGLNGAGKTTTFKMITGECSMSSGDVYLDGFSVRVSLRKVQQRFGYCPQFDALIDQLTGRETLTMFARLRGLPERSIREQVSELSSLLSLDTYIDKQVSIYSGGNKRKLSVAVALIGRPPMVFLDEPTTGMDPVSRHSIWNALLNVLMAGHSIILTSHSMDECEALCNKLVIMVNGRFCCLGSPQQLKSKFGKGFTLIIKVRRSRCSFQMEPKEASSSSAAATDAVQLVPPSPHLVCRQVHHTEESMFRRDVQRVRTYIADTFPGSVLKDVHDGYLHYHIPKSGLSWSQIFGLIEGAKETLNISDYSVGQTTLEQVFLNFARSQRGDEV